MRFREEWHTLAHVMGGWNAKLRGAEREGKGAASAPPPGAPGIAGVQPLRSRAPEPNEPSINVEKPASLGRSRFQGRIENGLDRRRRRVEPMSPFACPSHYPSGVRSGREGCPWPPSKLPARPENGAQGAGAVGPASPPGHYVEAPAAALIRSLRVESSRNPGQRPALC